MPSIGKTLLIGTASSLLGAIAIDYVLSNRYFKIESVRQDSNREQVLKTIASRATSLNMQKEQQTIPTGIDLKSIENNSNLSLLDQFETLYGEELSLVDHYRTTISPSKSMNRDLTCTEMAQSFYTSPLFGLEKMILARVEPTFGNLENSIIEKMNFDIGDNVSIFKVIEKRENEILLRTPWGSLSWMKVVKKEDNEYELNFGSGILTKERLASSPGFRCLIPFHAIYSRYLLVFTKIGLLNKL